MQETEWTETQYESNLWNAEGCRDWEMSYLMQ